MDEACFSQKLYAFMAARGTPIGKIPVFDHRELDLYRLYKGVVSRGGLETVIENKLWRAITTDLDFDPDRTDAGFRLRLHYLRLLYAFERVDFLKLEDDVTLEFEHQFTKCHKTRTRDSHIMVKNADEKGGIRKMPPRAKKPATAHPNGSANSSPESPLSSSSSSISKDSELDERESTLILGSCSKTKESVVNFHLLDSVTLKKYKEYHRIKINKKEALADAVSQHFVDQHIDEDAVINSFVAHVKCDNETQRERKLRRRNAARFKYLSF